MEVKLINSSICTFCRNQLGKNLLQLWVLKMQASANYDKVQQANYIAFNSKSTLRVTIKYYKDRW